jgi:hypothetical protein
MRTYKMKINWNKVSEAIGFINATMHKPALLDLNLPNANPSYGGNVGLFTAEHNPEATTYTVLNLGYYDHRSAEEWKEFALDQLDEKQQRVFEDGLSYACFEEADGGIHCSCGASAEVEFDEAVTMCASCAGSLIGAALEDEQTVAEYMTKGDEEE